jgi:hypothetical protein
LLPLLQQRQATPFVGYVFCNHASQAKQAKEQRASLHNLADT